MSLVDKPIFRTLTGKNKAGTVIFAVLDALPIPPVHEIIKAVLSKDAPKNTREFMVAFHSRVNYLRLVAGILFSSIIISLALKGALTPEQVAELIQVIVNAVFGI